MGPIHSSSRILILLLQAFVGYRDYGSEAGDAQHVVHDFVGKDQVGGFDWLQWCGSSGGSAIVRWASKPACNTNALKNCGSWQVAKLIDAIQPLRASGGGNAEDLAGALKVLLRLCGAGILWLSMTANKLHKRQTVC